MRRRRALTLIEVVISLGILALVVGSVVLVYSGLLAATRTADNNQEAVAALTTVCDVWKIRLREDWPVDPPPDPGLLTYPGQLRDFTYQVDDYGRVNSPEADSFPDGDARQYLNLKRVVVILKFQDETVTPPRERTLSTIFYVGH
ncbi:MAG: type II secretion system protein [Vulcanimicrobiota bacterium]